jgi:hypothetical protein
MKWGGLRRLEADGGIAQLVEHHAGSVRVRSSSLLASTKERSFLRAFFSAILAARGRIGEARDLPNLTHERRCSFGGMMVNLRVICLLAAAALLTGCAATARAQEVGPPCTSSIQVLFNRYTTTHAETGSTIWFSGVLEGVSSAKGDLGSKPIRIDVRQSRITFGRWQHVITLPDSIITIDPSTRDPQRWWVDNSAWSVAYAPSQIPEAFFDGMPYEAPEPFVAARLPGRRRSAPRVPVSPYAGLGARRCTRTSAC